MRAAHARARTASGRAALGGAVLLVVGVAAGLVACSGAAPVAPAVPVTSAAAVHDVSAALSAERAAMPSAVRAACSSDSAWHPSLSAASRRAAEEILDGLQETGIAITPEQRTAAIDVARKRVFWWVVRTMLVGARLHNAGVVELPGVKTANGAPLRVYRTAFTPTPAAPNSCVQALLAAGGVRHIVNLYAGPMTTSDLEQAERAAVEAAGGTYQNARDDAEAAHWREQVRDGHDPREAMRAVARIVREHVLRPGGKAPQGNVHVHCGGGMHRTGMVMGVIERCLAGASMAAVEARYKAHVGWRSESDPGGYEAANVAFIRSFDCSLVQPAR